MAAVSDGKDSNRRGAKGMELPAAASGGRARGSGGFPAGGGGRAIPHADRLKSPRAKQSCFFYGSKKKQAFPKPKVLSSL